MRWASCAALAVLAWTSIRVGAVAPHESTLPVTVDERIAACTQIEDSEPRRAIALAQSVLEQGTALSGLQRAEAVGCRGYAWAVLGQHDDARRDAHALFDLVHAVEDHAARVRLTRRAGVILHQTGDRVGALDFYAQAANDAESHGLESERVALLINLGVLHSELEEPARAQVNYEQALALMERLDDHRYEAPVRYNLGLTLDRQDRHADAVPHLRRALELIREQGAGGPAQELSATIALANALHDAGATDEVAALLRRARTMDVPSRDTSADMQIAMLEARQRADAGDLAGAITLLQHVNEAPLTEIQIWDLLRLRADLLQRAARHEEAAAELRRIIDLRERYLRHRNHERLAALDAHMRDREQRLELERLQASADTQARLLESRKRMTWLVAGIAGLLLVAGSLVLFWQRRMNRRLYRASHVDPLTDLANRREMTERLRATLSDPGGFAGVFLIDIDLFKQINDSHGHDIGDHVLIAYARRLRGHFGPQAHVARWGGEEFLVLLPHCNAESARSEADRLRRLLAEPVMSTKGALHVGASIGYANLPLPGAQHAGGWQASVQLADSALYLAKRAGRDAWAGYWIDREIPDWPPERIGREAELARSLHVITPVTSRSTRVADATAH